MERLRMLLRGEKNFFPSSAPAWFVITKSHRDERTDSRAEWLAGQAPRIKAPRPNLALMFRKLPEKKHNASKGGDFASINPSRGRGPHRHQWCEPCPTVFPPFEAREARSSPRSLVKRYCAAGTLLARPRGRPHRPEENEANSVAADRKRPHQWWREPRQKQTLPDHRPSSPRYQGASNLANLNTVTGLLTLAELARWFLTQQIKMPVHRSTRPAGGYLRPTVFLGTAVGT